LKRTTLLLLVLLARAAAAQDAAPRPPAREMPRELGSAVTDAKQASKRYRSSQQSEAAQELVEKTARLLDNLGQSAATLPSVVEGRKATTSAKARLQGPAAGDALKRDVSRVASSADSLIDVVERTYAPTRAIVVSGGVSMGSYQAGFLYFYARALRFYDERLANGAGASANGRFQIATGASAGSINSFLAALDGCLEPELDPEQSLFYRTWTGIGLEQLIPQHPDPSADGLFSEDAFNHDPGPLKLLRDLWAPGRPWPKVPCQTALGITATRLAPRRVNVIGDQIRTTDGNVTDGESRVLGLDRMTEKFLLTISSKGDGTAPQFSSRRFQDANDEIYPTLGEAPANHGPDGLPVTSDQVVGLLSASAAFPLAFSPKVVPVTTWFSGAPAYERRYDPNAHFTDGGFLDNTPLRIAQKLTKTLASTVTAAGAPPPPRPRVLLLMSSALSWKRSGVGQPTESAEKKSVLGRYLPFIFNFLSTTSDGALIDVFEDDPGTFTYDIPMRPFPVAADPLGHFFAFAEPSFRRFDFYQGMIDAEELYSGRVLPGKSPIPFKNDAVLECFRSYRRQAREAASSVPSPGPACAGVDGRLTALLQASAERRITVSQGDDDFEQFTAALLKYDFKYEKLASNKPLTSTGVALALRKRFDRLGSPFASAQPDLASKLGVAAVAPVATDLWRYRARTYLGLGIPGDATLQVIFSWPFKRWQRWSLRADGGGFLALYPKPTDFMTPEGTHRLWRYPLQLNAGLATDVVINEAFLLELGASYAARTEYFFWESVPYFIHGVGGHLTLTFGERIFLNLEPSYFFGGCAGNNHCSAIDGRYAQYAPTLVAPAPFVADNASFKLSAGWRFLW
jgi:hypothetical protein